jgi:glucose-1-phosphate thymidylyltransferase
MEILEDGHRLGCKIYYTYVREVDGPGRELWIAEDWVNGEDFVLMLGDSLYLHPLDFRGKPAPHIWTMPLDGLDDPSKYGQVKTEGDRVIELREKPLVKFSDTIQTATWLFPSDVFEKAKIMSESRKGEIHIGMLSEEYVQEGRMTHTPLPPQSYIDLGTPDALLKGANLLAEQAIMSSVIH